MKPDVHAAFKVLNEKLNHIIKLVTKESFMLEDLKKEVERNRAVDESARLLIEGLVKKLEELSQLPTVTPEDIAELALELRTSTDELVASITANTPAEEE